jgi:hypothetical protein
MNSCVYYSTEDLGSAWMVSLSTSLPHPCIVLKRIVYNLNYSCKLYTDKKEKKIFLIYKAILNGAVAKSYMTNGLLIYG